MPQKRNPDPFELVRGCARRRRSEHMTGALGFTVRARAVVSSRSAGDQTPGDLDVERSLAALDAFERALRDTYFDRVRGCRRRAGTGYTVATDVADALIAARATARERAHALVGAAVARPRSEGARLDERDLATLARDAGITQFNAPLDRRELDRGEADQRFDVAGMRCASARALERRLAAIEAPS